MEIRYEPALELSLTALAEALTKAFQGYYMEVQFTAAGVSQMVRCDSVDLGASSCAVLDGNPVAVGLIARRGWTSRIAVMGVVAEARGQGIGRQLMEQLVAEARERGARAMTLEVIEQNEAALSLYKSLGFRIVRRLVGYTTVPGRETPQQDDDEDYGGLAEVDLRTVAHHLMACGLPTCPGNYPARRWRSKAPRVAAISWRRRTPPSPTRKTRRWRSAQSETRCKSRAVATKHVCCMR